MKLENIIHLDRIDAIDSFPPGTKPGFHVYMVIVFRFFLWCIISFSTALLLLGLAALVIGFGAAVLQADHGILLKIPVGIVALSLVFVIAGVGFELMGFFLGEKAF